MKQDTRTATEEFAKEDRDIVISKMGEAARLQFDARKFATSRPILSIFGLILLIILPSLLIYALVVISVESDDRWGPVDISTITPEIGVHTDGVHTDLLVSVYDGDTFKVDIAGWPDIIGDDISVRIKGIDTPEIRGTSGFEKEMAIAAKKQLEDLLGNNTIYLFGLQRDKYFRILADVRVDNVDVAKELIDMGLAKRYTGETKTPWTESDYHEYKTKIAD
tara:strand:+ start:4025 stop:4687 length:663 start_codon:yes stop_codon:yes gene_type:complete